MSDDRGMPLEPSTAVTTLEAALRQLMAREYERVFGATWLESVSTDGQREKWQELYEEEARRRHGVAVVPQAGLAYSELSHLVAIAEGNWEPLSAALGARKKILPLLEHVVRLRNSAQHSRELMPFERDLVAGVAGLVRNEVTLHMSSQDPAGDFYPRIESAYDSFGAQVVIVSPEDQNAGSVNSDVTLHPGDVVTFTATGTDPQSRDLLWRLYPYSSVETPWVRAGSGETVGLEWVVADEHVQIHLTVGLQLVSDGQHHRAGLYDQMVFFYYRVDPPR